MDISGGDSISASVAEISPGLWHIHMRNATNGQTFDKDVTYDSSHTSAEWIQELPTGVGFSLALDSFGSAVFTGASATVNGATVSIAGSGAHALQMANRNNEVTASVSGLSADGSGFTVSRTGAPSSSVNSNAQRSLGRSGDYYTRPALRSYRIYVVQGADGLHIYLAR
jgi:hypothetical protein